MSVHRLNAKDYIVKSGEGVHYFEIAGRGATEEKTSGNDSFVDWKENPLRLGNYEIIPFGDENDLPQKIVDTLYPNHLARLQTRKVELLVEQGPYLYECVVENDMVVRKPVIDQAITDWLEAQNYEEDMHYAAAEFYNVNLNFTKITRDRASLVGLSSGIGQIEPLTASMCRLAYRAGSTKKTPTHIVYGDFKAGKEEEYIVYPIWDKNNPTKYPAAVHYTVRRSFGVPFYAIPEIYGALNWIKLSTSIPKILKALTENSLNIKWHIQSPSSYWRQIQKKLEDQAQKEGRQFNPKELDDAKNTIMQQLTDLLSGVENVGKFWHNEYVVNLIGGSAMEEGWKITALEQKIKDYVSAQLEIATRADMSVQVALGLHSSLANIGADGKSDSGSEQLYALRNHQITSTKIAEYYVTKAYNDMIKYVFGKNVKIGFWRTNIEREQDVSSSNRVNNQTGI